MLKDECKKCRNAKLLVFDQGRIENGIAVDVVFILYRTACRFGEKPSTCVEFKERRK